MGREVDYAQHDMRAPRDPQNMTVEDLWATQPHLRTVIDFRARNIAQLGVQLFEADGEQRARVRGTEVSKLLGRPNPYMTGYDLIYDLVATRSLYDTAYWFIMEDRKSTRLNSSHVAISYAVFCLKKKISYE